MCNDDVHNDDAVAFVDDYDDDDDDEYSVTSNEVVGAGGGIRRWTLVSVLVLP